MDTGRGFCPGGPQRSVGAGGSTARRRKQRGTGESRGGTLASMDALVAELNLMGYRIALTAVSVVVAVWTPPRTSRLPRMRATGWTCLVVGLALAVAFYAWDAAHGRSAPFEYMAPLIAALLGMAAARGDGALPPSARLGGHEAQPGGMGFSSCSPARGRSAGCCLCLPLPQQCRGGWGCPPTCAPSVVS